MSKIIPCVVGLGYVGLPIYLRLQRKFKTIGYDINRIRIKELNSKNDSNNEFNKKDLISLNNSFFTYEK